MAGALNFLAAPTGAGEAAVADEVAAGGTIALRWERRVRLLRYNTAWRVRSKHQESRAPE